MNNLIYIDLDSKIKGIQREIISKYKEQNPLGYGIDTHKLTDLTVGKISKDIKAIKAIGDLIEITISEMAIVIRVKFDSKTQTYLLDTRIDNIPDKLFGSIIKLTLSEIIFHQCTYQHTIKESIVASLLYNLVQKDEIIVKKINY